MVLECLQKLFLVVIMYTVCYLCNILTAAAPNAASASLDQYRVMYFSLDHLTPSEQST